MTKLAWLLIVVFVAGCLGCEGNTTGMYRHKQDHEEKPAVPPTP